MPFADCSFDLVWSLESGEHMPDKRKFMGMHFSYPFPPSHGAAHGAWQARKLCSAQTWRVAGRWQGSFAALLHQGAK